MFVDEVEIYVKAGDGGDGAVSFRREKYIPNGGPDGGDGGKGGDVIFEVDSRVHGLSAYTCQKRFLAKDGQNGMGSNKSGRNSEDMILKVPAGTEVYHHDNLVIDLVEEGQIYTMAKGGKGGWGNQHFATSIKQAPKWAKEGMKGESFKLKLVLKTIADVGLIGLPNAGKSTLLSVLTNARPKIADYPFTTLEPNLGTYVDKNSRIIIADIPGLIEGAAEGRGLGDKFLKHIERTKILVHLLDINSADIKSDYQTIRNELANFSRKLSRKRKIVVLNKAELSTDENISQKIEELKSLKVEPLIISAATHRGLDLLIQVIKKALL